MALEHPRYFIKHAEHTHELFLHPRGDSDYGLRTKSFCHVKEPCILKDKNGHEMAWDLTDVNHDDHVEFSYPFKVIVTHNGITETLINCDEEQLNAHPIALPLHEDLEIRLNSMLEEARCIEKEGICSREELKTLMAEPFEEDDIEEMCEGSFFRYFSALHNHHGTRVMLKFAHLPTDDGESFVLHFRAAKILVPHGRHFEDIFRHEHSISSLEAQNRIVRVALERAYDICGEMIEDKHESNSVEEDAVADESLENAESIAGFASGIKSAAKSVGSSFAKAGKAVGRGASRAGKAVGRRAVSAGKAVGRAAGRAGSAVASGARKVGGVASSAASRIRTAASSAAGRVRSAASSAATKVRGVASSAASRVSSAATRVKDTVAKKATSAKEAVAKKFGQVKDSVKGARDQVKDRVKSAKQSVKDKVQSLRGKKTGGASSKSSGAAPSGGSQSQGGSSGSTAVPQDKTAPVTNADGSSKVAGQGTSGDPRASGTTPAKPAKPDHLKGSAGSTVASKHAASDSGSHKAAASATGHDSKPAGDAAKQGGAPRRHGDDRKAAAPAAQAKADDGLAKYDAYKTPASQQRKAPAKNLPDKPAAKASNSKDPNSVKSPAPKPAANATSTFTHTQTNNNGVTKVTTTTNKGDGSSKTVTTKLRSDGTTKVTRTKTAADGTVKSTEKRDTRTEKASASASKSKKEPKEKKQGVLSKLKDKYDEKKQDKGSSGSGGSGSGGSSKGQEGGQEGGSGGGSASMDSTTGQGDSAFRPDYDRQMREDARRQDQQDRQNQNQDTLPPETINFGRRREDLGQAVVAGVAAGALTGAVVAAASQPPVYGMPMTQRLPPGYVMTANGVMALGTDGRVYPLTVDQSTYIQQFQMAPPPPGAMPTAPSTLSVPPPQGIQSASPMPSETPDLPNKFTPTSTVRLADDDEPLAVQDTSPPLRKVVEQRISDDINDTQDQERREVLLKYLVGQHGVVFGKSPTKQQKDKLRARIMAIRRPFIMTKVLEQYTDWLVKDVGVKA